MLHATGEGDSVTTQDWLAWFFFSLTIAVLLYGDQKT
jgi:hypothetical protein